MTPQPSRPAHQALVLDLYLSARDLPATEWRAFIENHTKDPEVLREVLWFLQAKTQTILNEDITQSDPRQLDTDPLKKDDVIAGRYHVTRKLGNGGMGVVYEVLDSAMEEKRALKVICAGAEGSADLRMRFYREVKTAQRVAHENVCRIYDIGFDPPLNHSVGQESDRLLFLTMEYLEGETLADRISRHQFSQEATLGIIRQVVQALIAAHEHGVIHRDIKPSNIMLVPRRDGSFRAVVMDFGLARCVNDEADPQLTRVGGVIGTIPYMAPEQALGQYTPATDVFALGIVIYEMLTGKRPFPPGMGFAERIPVPPSQYLPEIDPRWEAAILKCLSADASKRFQNPADLIAALEPPVKVPAPPPTPNVVPPWRPTRKQWIVAGLAAATITGVGILSFFVPPGKIDKTDARFVAVLPFSVVGDAPNSDLLALGLTDSLSARLFQWQNVRMPATAAVERVGNFPLKRIGRELGVNIVVRGSVQTDGAKVQVNLKIEDVAAEKILKQEVLSGTRSRYSELQDRVYATVVSALDLQSGKSHPPQSVNVASTNPQAADLFWKARQKMSQQRSVQDVREAIGYYEQSIKLDPTFARASAFLSDAYVVLYRSTKERIDADKAVYAAEQARRLDESAAYAHFALGYAYNVIGQTPAAISETRRALELAPNSADGHRRLGRIYQDSGDKKSALESFQRALEINPHDWNSNLQLAAAYFRYGDTANALQHYKRITEQVPERAEGFQGLGATYHQMGNFKSSQKAFEKALSIQKRPANYSGLGTAYHYQGRYADAIQMFQKAIELA
ncbi:MAG TPA: tetratricopeptide repeat protein, partial [Bryobacteraceae bacterium]|nr:tetratricopeptide repeat protein [Bryobacteraceae bacterium]